LQFLLFAAVLNGALADETNQAIRDLNTLERESEELRRNAENFDVPNSYNEPPVTRDSEADFDSLEELKKQNGKQKNRLKELKKKLKRSRLKSSELERQIRIVRRNINLAKSYIQIKMKKINDVVYQDLERKEKVKDSTKDTNDTGSVTPGADDAVTEEIAIQIPAPTFVPVNIPEIPAGPVCPEDKDALIDAAFEAEFAAGDNARAAQSTVLAISRAISDGKGNTSALKAQLKVAKKVVKRLDAVWDDAEKARKAALNLKTKDCSETTGSAGPPPPVSEQATSPDLGKLRQVNIPEIPAGPVCPEEKQALIMQATTALSDALHNMRVALRNNESLKKWADNKKKAEDAQNKALNLETTDCTDRSDSTSPPPPVSEQASPPDLREVNIPNIPPGPVCTEEKHALLKQSTEALYNAMHNMRVAQKENKVWADKMRAAEDAWRKAAALRLKTKDCSEGGEQTDGTAPSSTEKISPVNINFDGLYEVLDELNQMGNETSTKTSSKGNQDQSKIDSLIEQAQGDFGYLLALYLRALLIEYVADTQKTKNNNICNSPNGVAFERVDLKKIDAKITIYRERSKALLERVIDAEPGSESAKSAWERIENYIREIMKLENLKKKVEAAKKKAKEENKSSNESQAGIVVGSDNDIYFAANIPFVGVDLALKRAKNQTLKGETPSFGLPLEGLPYLSLETDSIESVSVCESDSVWTAQDTDEIVVLPKHLSEVGLADQWGIKAIDWKPSLVPSRGPVIVAVIDSGVDYNNMQFKNAIWKNPQEKLNGIDDDGNGYIDDIQGWNFIADNNDPMDDYGHGTMTAGTIAARPISGKGIFGVNPRATIMNLKVIDKAGNVGTWDVARAIYYAANRGAKVINLSLGGKRPSFIVDAAIGYAKRRGALVVVAAGNDAMDAGLYSSGSLGALAVAATDKKNKRLTISNWGHEVDIAAPGFDILSLRAKGTDMLLQTGTVPYMIGGREYWPWKKDGQGIEQEEYSPGKNIVKEGYYHATGTSFAAPFVSGVASLILSKDSELTAEQVTRMLLMSAKDVETPGWDQLTGYGLINARAALEADPDYYTIARIDKIAPAKKDGKLVIQVFGTAASSEFKGAWVELGFGENPKKWKKMKKIKNDVSQNLLAEIKPKEFNKRGKWSVRLIVKTKKHGKKEGWGSLDIN
jgi:subtilisin family serine protease